MVLDYRFSRVEEDEEPDPGDLGSWTTDPYDPVPYVRVLRGNGTVDIVPDPTWRAQEVDPGSQEVPTERRSHEFTCPSCFLIKNRSTAMDQTTGQCTDCA